MPYKVTCPLCQGQMMVKGQPAPEGRIQCVHGGHAFAFKAGAPTPFVMPEPALSRHRDVKVSRSLSPAMGVGIIAAILLAAGGIITAIIITRGEPADKNDNTPDPLATAKARHDLHDKERL